MIKQLLELKKRIKAKNPRFRRQDYFKWAKLADKYRKPKGIQSKQRHKLHGKLKYVQIGHRTPAPVRNMTKHGLNMIIISNVGELSKVNPKEDAIIISKVGTKKRIDIVKAANERKVKILNLKENYLTATEKRLSERKAGKEKKLAEKSAKLAKKKDAEKKGKAKKEEPVLTEEEKEKKDKEEKDKVLTKKGAM